MSILFEAYELLARSGLFDSDFYFKANPELTALNLDPLMHYLERGARARRDPSGQFDTSYYLLQCQELGEQPENALFHYLTVGKARGLRARPGSSDDVGRISGPSKQPPRPSAAPSQTLLYIDVPRVANGIAEAAVQGGVSIIGWALGPEGIAEIDVALDGRRAAVAYYGIRRPDVASAHPNWPGAMQCGFAAHLAPRFVTAGKHAVCVTVRDRSGALTRREFSIDVVEPSLDQGPGALRRGLGQREVAIAQAALERQGWWPTFEIFTSTAGGEAPVERMRATLESLRRQAYPHWRLCLLPPRPGRASGPSADAIVARLIKGSSELSGKILVSNAIPRRRSPQQNQYAFAIAPGDEFSADALQEFALHTASERDADFLYCDDRRASAADDGVSAFFKPQWSPDLLLSTNYIGRSWCVKTELLERTDLNVRELIRRGDYAVVLRLTEVAQRVRHLPKLLFASTEARTDPVSVERRALEEVLLRRKIDAAIRPGCADHYYRVKRRTRKRELVSIIVPTCAAGGHVQTCIESLRARTDYRAYEIICIDNIPGDRISWRQWLRRNADQVIPIRETFNWSRFNNRGAARAKGAHLLFLNDDVEIIEPDWLDALVEHTQRPEVGVVGPQLLYPDRSVQHAGIALDTQGRGRHTFRHLKRDDPGYFGLALTQRNVIAVTGACLMTRRDVFARLGGFEQSHAVINGDLDYCLRSWDAGLLNVYTPHSHLVHHELASRSHLEEQYDAKAFAKRWSTAISQGDPFFNPNLSLEHDQVQIEREPVETIFAGQPLFSKASVRRILVLKLDHIGDAITALASVRRLKRAFPEAKITVLAGRGTQAIWRSERCVEEVLEYNLFHLRSGLGMIETPRSELSALAELLRAKRFDLAIDLRKQPDTRHVLQVSGAGVLAGFDHQGRFPWLDVAIEWDEDVPLRTKRAHVSEDLNMLVDALVARSEPDVPTAVETASASELRRAASDRLFSRPLVCVHAASGSEMRQWPLAKFSELIDLLLAEGTHHVALIGGVDETEVAQQVLKGIAPRNRVFDLVGKLTLSQLPGLLSRAALFVGNNSGPQHVAARLGVPTVGIHSGVVDAHEWGPNGSRAVAIRRRMSCSPCFIEKAKDCPRALACLTTLEVRDVYRQCRRMLDSRATRAMTERAQSSS